MKNQIIIFILGIIFTLCIASTTNNLITIKPAIPTSIILKKFSFHSEIEAIIKDKYKQGYMIKSISYGRGDNWGDGLLIMEKY